MAEAGGMDAGTMLAVHLPLEDWNASSAKLADLVVANQNAPKRPCSPEDPIQGRTFHSKKGSAMYLCLWQQHSTPPSVFRRQPFECFKGTIQQRHITGHANSCNTLPADETGCRSLLANQMLVLFSLRK